MTGDEGGSHFSIRSCYEPSKKFIRFQQHALNNTFSIRRAPRSTCHTDKTWDRLWTARAACTACRRTTRQKYHPCAVCCATRSNSQNHLCQSELRQGEAWNFQQLGKRTTERTEHRWKHKARSEHFQPTDR